MIPFINIHTHKIVEGDTIGIYNFSNSDNIDSRYCSFGIHPWDLGKYSVNEYLIKFDKYCIENRIVAVGEIGIDRATEHSLEN